MGLVLDVNTEIMSWNWLIIYSCQFEDKKQSMFWQSHDHLNFDCFCTGLQFEFFAEVILLCPFFGSSRYI